MRADLGGRAYVSDLMRGAGLAVRVDTAGNIIARREGSDPGLPPIMFGSHIDSVPGGGNYDGDVGVIGAIEAAEIIAERRLTLRHPIEVVVFADEEGQLAGSRAMIGTLTDSALEVVRMAVDVCEDEVDAFLRRRLEDEFSNLMYQAPECLRAELEHGLDCPDAEVVMEKLVAGAVG